MRLQLSANKKRCFAASVRRAALLFSSVKIGQHGATDFFTCKSEGRAS